MSPSSCPPWQPEQTGPTRRMPPRTRGSYTTARDTISICTYLRDTTLAIERGTEPVMPENLDEIAFASAEDEQGARMRIATQALRDPQRQRVHPAPHVRHAGREPDPRPARNRDRRRSGTPSTRDSAAASTSRSTVTREPSARAISIRPEADGSISGAAGSSLAGAAPSGEETTTGTKPPTTRASSRYWRRQLKTGCAFTSYRRATTETEIPGR